MDFIIQKKIEMQKIFSSKKNYLYLNSYYGGTLCMI